MPAEVTLLLRPGRWLQANASYMQKFKLLQGGIFYE
jgi:hypothetical protein